MISSVNTNSVSFKSNVLKTAEEAQTQQKNKSFSEKFDEVKKDAVDFAKGVNTAVTVTSGATRGIVDGALVAGAIAIMGKNAKNANGRILGTIAGILNDAVSVIKVLPKTISKVWNNSPKDNVVSVFKSIPSGVKKLGVGIKKHKATAAIATVVGFGVLATRTIAGRIQANKINSDIDHKLNQGHIK